MCDKNSMTSDPAVGSTHLVLRNLRNWEKASSAYMVDCNTRPIKKPDATRERLRLANRIAFNRLTDTLKARALNAAGQRPTTKDV
jgi:hypothetical protein